MLIVISVNLFHLKGFTQDALLSERSERLVSRLGRGTHQPASGIAGSISPTTEQYGVCTEPRHTCATLLEKCLETILRMIVNKKKLYFACPSGKSACVCRYPKIFQQPTLKIFVYLF